MSAIAVRVPTGHLASAVGWAAGAEAKIDV
jgi:hypothetical protein